MSHSRGEKKTSELSPMTLTQSSTNFQEKLTVRQAKRAVKAAERRQKSDALREEGNNFFCKGDFQEALDRYQKAIAVHTSAQPTLLNNLAATYLKLGMYIEAHEAADNALGADPKSVKARYRRGMARKHLEMWAAAALDFRLVLKLDPENKDVQDALDGVELLRHEYWNQEDEDAFSYSECEPPFLEDEPELGNSLSESSDCEHTGNGIPCKFYNRTECRNGHACRFSHAPDVKSVRDALGRNVCRYYLIGACKFGDRCSYVHSKEYLLHKGWWSTTGGIDTEKMRYKFSQMCNKAIADYNKESRSGQASKNKQMKGKKKQGSRSGLGSVTGTTQPLWASRKVGTTSKKRLPTTWDRYDSNGDDELEDGMCGFTRSEVDELLCQGVKPWDDDAWDVLDALHSLSY